METTIHEADVKNLIRASEVYNKESEWAQKSGLYYSVQAKYNESEFQGEGPLGASVVWLMGLPAKRVLLFGAVDAWQQFQDKPKKLLKEWRIEERQKERMLLEAYRRMA
ncbi:MAG: hypothetical protein E3J66_00305 [Dehalococcoidia bacterium]|nr:MAG: hypothetical protein E3J66_00305 [Dehalococcoidia bacterium]